MEEALRTRRHAGIAFAGAPGDRRARIEGTGLDVWEVVAIHKACGEDTQRTLQILEHLSPRQVDAPLRYYRAYPEEIEALKAENERSPDEWERLCPHLTPLRGQHRRRDRSAPRGAARLGPSMLQCSVEVTGMPVVRPVSVRLEREVDAEVRDIARRDDRPLGRVINELLDRALRMRRFPGIVFVEGPGGVRAHLSGSGLDVWEIVALAHAYGSPEKVREALPALSEADMRLALAYGGTYPDEIEDRIRRNERPMEDLMREYPFVRKIPA